MKACIYMAVSLRDREPLASIDEVLPRSNWRLNPQFHLVRTVANNAQIVSSVIVIYIVPEFRYDEEIFTFNFPLIKDFSQVFTNFVLIGIYMSTVNVFVSIFYGNLHSFTNLTLL